MKTVRKLKAISPVIATLLLIAIAVSAGIILYVFVQGFVGQTGVAPPTVESIQMVGFDARDVANLCDPDHDNTPNGKLAASEFIILKLRNTGTTDILIEKIILGGLEHLWDDASSGVALSGTIPGAGEFALSTDACGAGGQTGLSSPVLKPGVDTFVVIKLSSSWVDLPIGRSLQVRVVTGAG